MLCPAGIKGTLNESLICLSQQVFLTAKVCNHLLEL